MALTPDWWYNSDEGLTNQKADFWEKLKTKLCTADVSKMLESYEWQSFLTELEGRRESDEVAASGVHYDEIE